MACVTFFVSNPKSADPRIEKVLAEVVEAVPVEPQEERAESAISDPDAGEIYGPGTRKKTTWVRCKYGCEFKPSFIIYICLSMFKNSVTILLI